MFCRLGENVPAGAAAHAGLIELLRQTGSYNELFAKIAPDDYDFRRDLLGEVTRRRSRLGALVDAILVREGDPDGATLFAYDLLEYNGAAFGRPPAEQAATFLSLLERAIEGEADRVDWNLQVSWAAEFLGRTRQREALPALRALLSAAGLSENNQVFLLRSVARLGGDAAVELLREVHDWSPPSLRAFLMGNVAMYDSGDEQVESFLRELAETSPEAGVRESLARSLSRREKDFRKLAARLDDAASTKHERMRIVETLLRQGEGTQRDAAWAHFEGAGAEFQDEMLASLANAEPRALGLLLERLAGDQVSRELAGGIDRLDAKLVHAQRERFARAAGDASLSARTRTAAAAALSKVDPAGAASALALGFEAGTDAERLEVVETLKRRVGGDAASAFLRRVAATDPAERVRTAASEE